jgi:uncharacterized protein YciI
MSTIAVVVLTYVKPLDQVDAQLAAHVEWLKQGYADGIFLASGRKIPRSGGVILAKGDDMDALQNWLSQDPFQQSGVAKVEIVPFEATMAAPHCRLFCSAAKNKARSPGLCRRRRTQ